MAKKNVLLQMKIEEILTDIMVQTGSDNVIVDSEKNETLATRLATIAEQISRLQAGEGGISEDDVNRIVSEAINALIDGAPESYNTLKEIADYISTNDTNVSILQGYFSYGKAINALNSDQLGGHVAEYFATADALNGAINGLTWRAPVSNLTALKAIKTPQEGWTVSVEDTNKIYRFDVESLEEGNDDTIVKPDDLTSGSWVLLGTTVYNKATSSADGLMSKEDKAEFDTMKITIGNKVDKEDGKGLSENDFTTVLKNKLEAIAEQATKTEKSNTNGNIKINGSETVVYTHPVDAGNKHIPLGGTSGQFLAYGGESGTAKWDTPKIIVKSGASAPDDLVNSELFFKLLN